MQAEPGHAHTHYNLGRVYVSLGRYEEAIGLFEAALALQPEHAPAALSLAEVYVKENDLKRARVSGTSLWGKTGTCSLNLRRSRTRLGWFASYSR